MSKWDKYLWRPLLLGFIISFVIGFVVMIGVGLYHEIGITVVYIPISLFLFWLIGLTMLSIQKEA